MSNEPNKHSTNVTLRHLYGFGDPVVAEFALVSYNNKPADRQLVLDDNSM